MRNEDIVAGYDRYYQTPNYFGDRRWLFRPFVRAIVDAVSLKRGSRVLDAGCGQGLFTALFAEAGMSVVGVDLSEVGILSASRNYTTNGARFEVGDILNLPYEGCFDLVFSRSLSLYNAIDFGSNDRVSRQLLRYARRGGNLVFDYHTKLAARKQESSSQWRYHTVKDCRQHFAGFTDVRCFFSTRLECRILRGLSFNSPVTHIASLFSRTTGIGGELVAFVPAQTDESASG